MGAAHSKDLLLATMSANCVDRVFSVQYRHCRSVEAWTPAANLYESDSHHYVVVDIAGMQAENIRIRMEGARLIISGDRRMPKVSESPMCIHVMEIDHGPFLCQLDLAPDADAGNIEAAYGCGYLRIQIPKKRQPRQSP